MSSKQQDVQAAGVGLTWSSSASVLCEFRPPGEGQVDLFQERADRKVVYSKVTSARDRLVTAV